MKMEDGRLKEEAFFEFRVCVRHKLYEENEDIGEEWVLEEAILNIKDQKQLRKAEMMIKKRKR